MKLQRLKGIARATGLVTGLIVIGLAVGSLFGLNGNRAGASDCSANAILKCGFSSPADFISKVQSGNGGTQNDLQTIYASYGLNSADYQNFAANAKQGTAYKDGRIVVDGKTVATDVSSIGRVQKNGDHAKVIGGTTYWEGSNQTAFASDSIPVWVLFDSTGAMQFAVLGDCGNPMSGTVTPPPAPPKPTPTAACTGLTVTAGDRTTYTLKATASVGGGATISSYNFAVTDSNGGVVTSKDVPSTDTSASTQVTLNNPGTYHAKTTVTTSVGPQTAAACEANITVQAAPDAACKQLTVTALDRTTYKLYGEATVSGGASVMGYDFTVKDAKGNTVASPSVNGDGLSTATNVTIDTPGAYTAALSVRTTVGAKTSDACQANFTVPEKPVPPTPSIKITKDVDGVKQKQVAVGQTFTYHITVTNDGKVDLTNAVVTDQPPAGVTLLTADRGTIANNAWTYTIPSLKIGETTTFALTAKVNAYIAGNLVNTACVNVPEVNNNQPLCDTATVTVTPPPTPVTPSLPNTGASSASSVVGIFLGVVATGVVLYRFVLNYKFIVGSRR